MGNRESRWGRTPALLPVMILLIVLCCMVVSDVYGRALDDSEDDVPRVYVDCRGCDYNHMRREIDFVHYVRDPEQADVHVFIRNEGTGSGGRLYTLSFIGRHRFSDFSNTFTYISDRNDTWDERRAGITSAFRLGLVPYLARTRAADAITVSISDEVAGQSEIERRDPWNHWLFNAYAGRIMLTREANRGRFDSRWGFSANRVTEDWKLRLRPYFNHDIETILTDGDEIVSTRDRHGVDSHVIRSITAHWSAGVFGDYLTRNDRNIRHRFRLSPAVEFSLFPYDDAARKAITFVYQVGYAWVDYFEETIHDVTDETLLSHQLQASVRVQQPWGDIFAGLQGSHYLHDISLRRAEFFTRVSFRVGRGFSINLNGDFEMIHDQLSLPKGDASLEEILLQRRELATTFSLAGSIGVSYTFGSQFANIVNTRL